MSAILFGSISTLADTSELQREAFNRAFADHGLTWRWDRDDYLAMLEKSGGADRIAAYAEAVGDEVDAAAVHATKSERFRESLATSPVSARPGVVETIRSARDGGLRVGLVTTTAKDNVTALLDALAPDVSAADFDVVLDKSDAERPKPDRDVYDVAVSRLHEQATACVAIEDNVQGAQAAHAAGVACVAFPNQNTAGHEFAAADRRVDRLELDELRQLIR